MIVVSPGFPPSTSFRAQKNTPCPQLLKIDHKEKLIKRLTLTFDIAESKDPLAVFTECRGLPDNRA